MKRYPYPPIRAGPSDGGSPPEDQAMRLPTLLINKERIEPKYTAPDIAPGAFAFLRDTVGRETKSKYIFGR